MTAPWENWLTRLRHVPRRALDELTRLRQYRAQYYLDNGYVHVSEDRWGRRRDERFARINTLRALVDYPELLHYDPPTPAQGDWSVRRINLLAANLPRCTRYLEIGIFEGKTLENVAVRRRVGVDPMPRFDVDRPPRRCRIAVMTSDEYFRGPGANERFDVAFIDGLHTVDQTYRDVVNAFAHVSGPLLIDDTVPVDAISAIPDQAESYRARDETGIPGRQWHGDVWRVVLLFERHHPELEWRTIVDGGNPQTLVWRRVRRASVEAVSVAQMHDATVPTYDEIFASGTPDFFRATSEKEALAQCISALRR